MQQSLRTHAGRPCLEVVPDDGTVGEDDRISLVQESGEQVQKEIDDKHAVDRQEHRPQHLRKFVEERKGHHHQDADEQDHCMHCHRAWLQGLRLKGVLKTSEHEWKA